MRKSQKSVVSSQTSESLRLPVGEESAAVLKSKYLQKGFTLVEALISAAILGVIGVIMVSLLNQSFQLNTKSQIISKIKQNGQNALSIMGEAVRNATSITCIKSDPAILTVAKNGMYTRFIMYPEDITNNGRIEAQDVSNLLVNKKCITTGTLPKSISILTDKDINTGVSLHTGEFKLNDENNNLTINFDLGPALKAPSSFESQTSLVNFQTTINVRDRNR